MTAHQELLHEDVTQKIIGGFFTVYNELGPGFLESVYKKALTIVLREMGLRVECERRIVVYFRRHIVGVFSADHLVDGCVLVESKAARVIDAAHRAQLLHYLKATPIEVGLILNFGPRADFERLVAENSSKRALHPPPGSNQEDTA